LGVPPERIPTSLDAQVALYRTLLAGKRILVVLDNARDAAQVRPLLPGAAGCMTVVTSRNQLTPLLAAEGAHLLNLDLLSREEAHRLLRGRLGSQRVTAELEATETIITRCAGLPLALAIVAAHATARPHTSMEALADELTDARASLDTLNAGDPATDLRAVLSWSYQALTPEAARLFRLIGLHPGPDITAPAAASLAAVPLPLARRLLAQLVAANLLTEHRAGRYTFHDLLRAYAAEQAQTVETDRERHAATHRLLDHYLHTAHAANPLLNPARDPIAIATPQPGVAPEERADHRQAQAWFSLERPTLLAAIAHAAAAGFDTQTWQLAWALWTFLDRQGHWYDWIKTGHAAATAAARLADRAVEANAHRTLARAYTYLGRPEDAQAQLRRALDLTAQIGDQVGRAHTHLNMGGLCDQLGRFREALDHARQALNLYRAASYRRGQALALNSIGWYHAKLGDHQQTITYCQQAQNLAYELGDRDAQAATWDSLGYAHHHLGRHTQAFTCYRHALDLFRDLGDRYYEATTLTHLGDNSHAIGDVAAAKAAWNQALTILTELNHSDAARLRSKLDDEPPK
jgi:tetratricopeptide (TPR) repeat protein